ncbi:hypothetical protein CesoFtcFv8_004237 [Champsocephalus esox]|uniref:Uncharacterized protein n=1 Tax=Champsocephalus esox TaxID=159716 RepID=A0AAN8HBY7_9TELE|nr:hypothetical protein CesoFtcFv8_004237 [Champsocephalus esox]
MASIASLVLPVPTPGSLKWLVKHGNTDSITLGKHAATAPSCVGWLRPSHSHSPSTPSDRVKLFLLSGGQGPSVSTSALNRAHRNPPKPLLPPRLSLLWYLSLSAVPPLPVSWHTVTPLIEIINQTGQIRLQIQINDAPRRPPPFLQRPALLTALPSPSSSFYLIHPRCHAYPSGSAFVQTVGAYYCFIDINNWPYLRG